MLAVHRLVTMVFILLEHVAHLGASARDLSTVETFLRAFFPQEETPVKW